MTHRSEREKLIAVAMPHAFVDRLDSALEYSRRMSPHQPLNRSILIRHLLCESLDRLDENRKRD